MQDQPPKRPSVLQRIQELEKKTQAEKQQTQPIVSKKLPIQTQKQQQEINIFSDFQQKDKGDAVRASYLKKQKNISLLEYQQEILKEKKMIESSYIAEDTTQTDSIMFKSQKVNSSNQQQFKKSLTTEDEIQMKLHDELLKHPVMKNSQQLHEHNERLKKQQEILLSQIEDENSMESESENEEDLQDTELLQEYQRESQVRKTIKQQNVKISFDVENATFICYLQPLVKEQAPKKSIEKIKDVKSFVITPSQEFLQCTIQKETSGFFGIFSPKYHLHLSEGFSYLMSAQKKLLSNTSHYVFSLDKNNFSEEKAMGRLVSNFFCNEYRLYDGGKQPDLCKKDLSLSRSELGYIQYAKTSSGEPRVITVVIPKIIYKAKNSLFNDYKNQKFDNLSIFKSRYPKLDKVTGAYSLNFHGRASKASAKNCQLLDGEEQIFQLGKVNRNVYNLDFKGLSPLIAFQIALSAFDDKINWI